MNQICPDELYNAAINLANIAATISKKYFRTELIVDTKIGNYPVTVADSQIEEVLRYWINEHYPTHGIIGEELANQEAQSEYTWVIDPIDGTTAFTTGKPTFTTLIALLKDNQPILGIIDQAIINERFIGTMHQGSWLNDKQLQTNNVVTLNLARLNATTPFMFNAKEYATFNKLAQQVKLTAWGGDAYAYALLASGYIDVILESDLKYYDVAALLPIVQMSGGIISDWHGNPITPEFNGQCLACANLQLHNQVLELINN